MSPRPSLLALLGLTLATGCGPAEPDFSGAHFGMELLVDRAVAGQLGAFQVFVLPNGQSRNCTEIQRTCLSQQVKADEPLLLKNGDTEARVLRFTASLQGTTVRSQDMEVEVPVGRDYALVIEALSTDNPPRFLGSSCNYLKQVNAGLNESVLAAPITLTNVECNPTFAN
jgi:hypothetical protein